MRFFVAALLVCLTFSVPTSSRTGGTGGTEILGFRVTPDGLEIRVPSGGCTSKEHFRLHASKNGGTAKIDIDRLQPDRCKGFFPDGKAFNYTWDELGVPPGAPLDILTPVNPLAAP